MTFHKIQQSSNGHQYHVISLDDNCIEAVFYSMKAAKSFVFHHEKNIQHIKDQSYTSNFNTLAVGSGHVSDI